MTASPELMGCLVSSHAGRLAGFEIRQPFSVFG